MVVEGITVSRNLGWDGGMEVICFRLPGWSNHNTYCEIYQSTTGWISLQNGKEMVQFCMCHCVCFS